MAHRKLQQEVDRVFKKINEGLDVFNTYYERHESCLNNPSQKEKLEADLKREVKKLQRLREQIKSWQSSPDIKNKDELLDYRRSVEVAMEQYKIVEKASKEKAYSNNSLKKSENMDPEERKRRETSDYLSSMIDELERQYEASQIEIDRLILLNKKKKTASVSNDEKKDRLKNLQVRYRWHQQQMELALRLLANEELDPDAVDDIQDDIDYYVKSNSENDFIEDETIYDTLNLQSNEAIAHEVAQYFASQLNNDEEAIEEAPGTKESLKQSRKEQRKAEREAKKAAKAAAKLAPKSSTATTPTTTQNGSTVASTIASPSSTAPIIENQKELSTTSSISSLSPSPIATSLNSSKVISASTTVPNTARSPNSSSISSMKSSSVSLQPTELDGTIHIHQGKNGATTTSTLRPATVPIRPAGEMKWSVAASHGLEKEKKSLGASSTNNASTSSSTIINQDMSKSPSTTTAPTSSITSRSSSVVNTPTFSHPSLATPTVERESLYVSSNSSSTLNSSNIIHQTSSNSKGNNFLNQLNAGKLDSRTKPSDVSSHEESVSKKSLLQDVSESSSIIDKNIHLLVDDYESDITDDELENEPNLNDFNPSDIEGLRNKLSVKNKLNETLLQEYELLLLPSGIQQFIMGTELYKNKLNSLVNDLGGYRRSRDSCFIPRLHSIPYGVNPPTPLDAFRSTQQWDVTCCSLRDVILSQANSKEDKLKKILEKFRSLETFTLFYNYYFSVTPLEKEVSMVVLAERDWRITNNETMWFSRQGEAKLSDELYEIGDYRIFSLEDWTVHEKLNFKLDFGILKETRRDGSITTVTSNSQHANKEEEQLSHGQQLLQQLKRGKFANDR